MIIAILVGFVAAGFAPGVSLLLRHYAGWALAIIPAALFAYFLSLSGRVAGGEVIRESLTWVPAVNLNLTLALDGLGLMFALIITGIGTLIFIYGGGYLKGDAHIGRFYAVLLVFMSAMLGVVLADNVLMLFVFWELTSISSYVLISYKHEHGDSRLAALRALVVTGGGGLALLAGFVLLGVHTSVWEISGWLALAENIPALEVYGAVVVLIALGAFTKSAQFPFHPWLPGAMAAPTPISAYLHSATMVKAGVFLLLRLNPILGGTELWSSLLMLAGGVTMFIGAYLSLKQHDLKRILAYSTISSLGMMTLLVGVGTKLALEAAVLLILVHAMYKGALFMVAGAIDHATGTRDITRLGGLWRVMPVVAVGAGLAGLSMSGIPPMIGFIGKELIYEAALGYNHGEIVWTVAVLVVTVLAVFANMAGVAVACMVALKPFIGDRTDTPHTPHGAGLAMSLGVIVPGLGGLLAGVFAQPLGERLIAPAISAAYGHEVTLKLALWHGITPMLWLSLLTVAGGVLIYWQRANLRPLLDMLDAGTNAGSSLVIDGGITHLPHFAARITGAIQNGRLRYYITTIIITTTVLLSYILITQVRFPSVPLITTIELYEFLLVLVIFAGLYLVVTSHQLLKTVVSLGVIGYSVSLLFLMYGAPDLAMTQFSIETLSVILFVLSLYRLPKLADISPRAIRIRDWAIASSMGLVVAFIVLDVSSQSLDSPLRDFFAENSEPLAHGRNIVNVILVDFRGFDTLGEITVLSVAAIGIYALLKLHFPHEEVHHDE